MLAVGHSRNRLHHRYRRHRTWIQIGLEYPFDVARTIAVHRHELPVGIRAMWSPIRVSKHSNRSTAAGSRLE
ncbi:hypothetical protein DV706_12320 [Natronorubrum bangense]|uniref:Uncharacterized protein n=2 Tax=Natronorubrum bangense TaxID=61858 RepID=L9WTD5_9EURY|nr:hypothetical protein C494_00792 [Natronorubrum bangense JCM 10635]QCC55185.1 hypothetical protein DV706_12320 [Natronorubrum bangense]